MSKAEKKRLKRMRLSPKEPGAVAQRFVREQLGSELTLVEIERSNAREWTVRFESALREMDPNFVLVLVVDDTNEARFFPVL